MGPALDCYITDVRCNGDLFPRPSVAIISNAITVNGKADLDIRLSGYCGEVPNQFEENVTLDKPPVYSVKNIKLSFYIVYHDLYETPYQQKITLIMGTGISKAPNEPWQYSSELSLHSVRRRETSDASKQYRQVPYRLDIKDSQKNLE